MTTEEKLQAMKDINSEIEKVEEIITKLSSGPGNYHIEITPGMVNGVMMVCNSRKEEMISEAKTLMKSE